VERMQSTATNVNDYLLELDDERKAIVTKLRQTILDNLPEGFEETMGYGLMGYVVPLSLYPKGYHVDPHLPLPFAGIGNQKHYVSFYHMGIYADMALRTWFLEEFAKRVGRKPDMGKSCLRLNPKQAIPYDLIGELIRKISVKDWIDAVESVSSK
jgi:uncharacterized protein YdhG (YjbR/CyaY superfamily)